MKKIVFNHFIENLTQKVQNIRMLIFLLTINKIIHELHQIVFIFIFISFHFNKDTMH